MSRPIPIIHYKARKVRWINLNKVSEEDQVEGQIKELLEEGDE